jgi:hypothetical protein
VDARSRRSKRAGNQSLSSTDEEAVPNQAWAQPPAHMHGMDDPYTLMWSYPMITAWGRRPSD